MTLQTQTASITYTGNGAATNFAYPFKIISASNLSVTRVLISTGAGTPVLSSDYTVNGAGGASGGSIDYLYLGAPLPATHKLIIARVVPYTQDLDIANEAGFFPEVVEQQLDLLAMQIQQLKQQVADAVSGGTIITLTGAVAGPAVAVNSNFALFSGTSGLIIKDAGYGAAQFAAAAHTHSFASLTSKPTTISGYGITDLTTSVGDAINTLFAAGAQSGITVTYDNGIPSLSLTVTTQVWTEIVKTSTTTIASNTTLASDAQLQFTMEANKSYVIEGEVHLSVSSVSGQKSGITGPAAPGAIRAFERESDNNNTTTISYATSYTSLRSNLPAANREVIKRFVITIENGANAGTFALQFAQNTSSVTVLTVRLGSFIRYRVIS